MMKIEYLEEVGLRKEYSRRYLESGEDIAVCARRQTGGKGTKGRSFLSCEGGVYLSFLRFFSDSDKKGKWQKLPLPYQTATVQTPIDTMQV